MAEVIDGILIDEVETKNIMTKSGLPVGGYSVNPFVDNEMPYGRVPQGHPVIVDYFYHEEIRGTENSGKRNR